MNFQQMFVSSAISYQYSQLEQLDVSLMADSRGSGIKIHRHGIAQGMAYHAQVRGHCCYWQPGTVPTDMDLATTASQ